MARVQPVKYLFTLCLGLLGLLASFSVNAAWYDPLKDSRGVIRNQATILADQAAEVQRMQLDLSLQQATRAYPATLDSAGSRLSTYTPQAMTLSNGSNIIDVEARVISNGTRAAAIGRALGKALPVVGAGLAILEIAQDLKQAFSDDPNVSWTTDPSGNPVMVIPTGGSLDGFDYWMPSSGTQQQAFQKGQVFNTPSEACRTMVPAHPYGVIPYTGATYFYCTDSPGSPWSYGIDGNKSPSLRSLTPMPATPDSLTTYSTNKIVPQSDAADRLISRGLQSTDPIIYVPPVLLSEDGKTIIIPDSTWKNVGSPTVSTTSSTDPSTGNQTQKTIQIQPQVMQENGKPSPTYQEQKTEQTQTKDPAGNVISNTTTVTTTNNTTNTTKASSNPLCALFPDILACKTLDEATTQKLPTDQKNVTLQSVDLGLGGGSCPQDVVLNIRGRSTKVVDMQDWCSRIQSWVRPLVLLISTFTAFMILFAGSPKAVGE